MSRHASARGGFLFHAEGRQFWVVAAVRNERTEGIWLAVLLQEKPHDADAAS
jgi:hypothetical protein